MTGGNRGKLVADEATVKFKIKKKSKSKENSVVFLFPPVDPVNR
jgi:hypothetical protein